MEEQLCFALMALILAHYIVRANLYFQINNFEHDSRLRLQTNFQLYSSRRRRIAHHFREKRRALLLNDKFVISRRSSGRSIRSIWAYARSDCWWSHIYNTWTDKEWLSNFRMCRSSFDYLCDILRPWLKRQNTRFRQAIPVENRVAICIWRLATNLEFRSISHLFAVGISTCCIITQEVVAAINSVLKPMYLKHPSAAELRLIVQGFRDRWRFSQVAGAIDGTHITIRAPSKNSSDYYNRKGGYSIILQGVVDHRMRFWDINVGRPGKVHDARVFCLSSLYELASAGTLLPHWSEVFEGVDVPLLLLGDSAYPLLPWLMKPYPEGGGITPQQLNFNHKLSQARMTVERAFGRLKGRWRCLLKLNDTHITFISRTVSACCVLHNYCEYHSEEYLDGDTEVEEAESGGHQEQVPGQQQPKDIRDALCSYFSKM